MIWNTLVFLVLSLWSNPINKNQPIELGKVNWLRDYDLALEKSDNTDLPILILFQEVPGCSTCQNYGQNVLSHPLVVDLIHSHFIPLAIYNNKGGRDAAILKKYNEPSWNNPVVRVVDDQGKNIVPRLAGNYSALGLVQTIKQGILESKRVVPEYLYLLEEELMAKNSILESATYSMYCFWSGEKLFGGLEGVVKTRAGWAEGKEVVQIEYNPKIIDKKSLDGIAKQNSCQISSANRIRDDREPKYYLSNSLLKHIPLSEVQASRINTLLAEGGNYLQLLSPTQQKWLLTIQKSAKRDYNNLVQIELSKAWNIFESQLTDG